MLIARVGSRVCALPIEHVVETMRPLPIEPVAGAPAFVRGLAIVRGEPIPVIEVAALIGATAVHARRFVVVRAGVRRVALEVEDVLDVRPIPRAAAAALPPLLAATDASFVAAIGTLDRELMVVLDASRVIPDDAPWLEARA